MMPLALMEAQFYKHAETKHRGLFGPWPLPGAWKAIEGSELFDPTLSPPSWGGGLGGRRG